MAERLGVSVAAAPDVWQGKVGFYISPGSDEHARTRADALYGLVAEVAESQEFGLRVESWFDDAAPGTIMINVLRRIARAPVVFADLTDRNPNVYYEVGVAHAFAIPVVSFIRRRESIAFDLAGERTINVDFDDDLVTNKSAIRTTIRAVLRHIRDRRDEVVTPVQLAGLLPRTVN